MFESGLLVRIGEGSTVKKTCEEHNIAPTRGIGYYLLAKKEKVSQSKDLVLYDAISDSVLAVGNAPVRLYLGLPTDAPTLSPDDVGTGLLLFVNSTSPNRKIPPGPLLLAIPPSSPVTIPGSKRISAPSAASSASSASSASTDSGSASSSSSSLKRQRSTGGDNNDDNDDNDDDDNDGGEGPSSSTAASSTAASLTAASSTPSAPKTKKKKTLKMAPMFEAAASNAKAAAAPRSTSSVNTWTWSFSDTVMVGNVDVIVPNGKVAGFDMDGTIITTASGKTFARDHNDWRILFPEVGPKLRSLVEEGYKIVVFTNQNGIGKGKVTPAQLQTKIRNIFTSLGVDVVVLAATEADVYRKPATGMFDLFLENYNGDAGVDKNESFYVGDAAGRAAKWAPGKKKDFACSDRKFAHNVGIPFFTPEEFFLDQAAVDFEWRGVDPRTIPRGLSEASPASPPVISPTQEMVLMVGMPGSGKSYYARTVMEEQGGYVRVNRDTLGTQAKCLKAVKAALAAGSSVVVDNTNSSPKARAPYIKAAQAAGVPVRVYVMDTPREIAEHMNMFRANLPGATRKRVPGVAYNMYKKHFVYPVAGEGIAEIKVIEFRVDFSSDPGLEVFFNHFT